MPSAERRPGVPAHRKLLAVLIIGLAVTGCGAGLEFGASFTAGNSGGGGGGASPAAPTPGTSGPVIPPPLREIPPDTLYAHRVLVHMRGLDGRIARMRVWNAEYKGKRVAGQGVVTKRQPGAAAPTHIQFWMDLDADGTVDVIYNDLNSDFQQHVGITEGATVWYEGTLKRYEGHLFILGEWIQAVW